MAVAAAVATADGNSGRGSGDGGGFLGDRQDECRESRYPDVSGNKSDPWCSRDDDDNDITPEPEQEKTRKDPIHAKEQNQQTMPKSVSQRAVTLLGSNERITYTTADRIHEYCTDICIDTLYCRHIYVV